MSWLSEHPSLLMCLMIDDGLLNTEHVLLTGEDESVLTTEFIGQAMTDHMCHVLVIMVKRLRRSFWKISFQRSKGETNNKNKMEKTHKTLTQVTVK